MFNLDKIYGKVDKIRNLRLVENNKTFRLMNNQQILELANRIVQEIEKSGCRTVISSECGSTPIIQICSKIAKYKNLSIDWFFFKTPRQLNVNLYEMMKYYLSEEELNEKIEIKGLLKTRQYFLNEFCKRINIQEYLYIEKVNLEEVLQNINKSFTDLSLDEVLIGTNIYNIFSNEFIFFDEYILSGTILRNFNFYTKIICKNAKFKIGAYAIFIEQIDKYENIQFSIYNKNTLLNSYTNGVYPYEDRIDFIRILLLHNR